MPDNREIVLEALLLYEKGEYADKIIKSILDKYSYLERFERGFINRVFTGTIERRLFLDFIINNFSSVKVNKQKPVIRTILRMSTYQLMFMDSVPDSATINEAVKLAKKKKFQGLSGFVNGVLRKIAKEKNNITFPSGDDRLSVMYSCPKWLCDHFISECGVEKTEKVLANSLLPRPVIIRTNLSKITTKELREKLINEGVTVMGLDEWLEENNGTDDGLLDIKDTLVIEDIDGLSQLESFENGLFVVQDLSSQAVFLSEAEMMKKILKKAELVIDVCAAPGGKTCHAADLLNYLDNKTCRVIARDLTDSKADRIDENVERCGFENVDVQVFDALDLDKNLIGKADLVIADLPCSGLGVIGRKVDIKYRVCETDLAELSKLQKEILSVVSQYVKPGGMLIFSTCTVNKSENMDNVDWIEKNLSFTRACEPLQLYNDSSVHDGFFISRFYKE